MGKRSFFFLWDFGKSLGLWISARVCVCVWAPVWTDRRNRRHRRETRGALRAWPAARAARMLARFSKTVGRGVERALRYNFRRQ